MTYDVIEESVDDGQPIELYEFRYQSKVFRYTSNSEDVVYLSATYLAVPLSRSGISQTQETARNNITVTTDYNQDVILLFRDRPPSDVVRLSIIRIHKDDDESVLIWSGRVLNAEILGASANLHCEPIFTSIKRPGMRRHWQRACPHVLYDTDCRASKILYELDGTVTGVTGNILTIIEASTKDDGYFSGGFAKWQKPDGDIELRMITSHTGNQITMTFAMPGLSEESIAQTVQIYPGCPHTLSVCGSRFSNVLNYGGQPWIPQKNPFDGTKIY